MDIWTAFQDFRAKFDAELLKPITERKMPKFDCPKATREGVISKILDLFENDMKKEKFKESIRKCFISTGCAPRFNADPDLYEFEEYSTTAAKGTMKVAPSGTVVKEEFPATFVDGVDCHSYSASDSDESESDG